MHAQRLKRHGDPAVYGTRIVGDDVARFWSYVDKGGPVPADRPDLGPCWLWTGYCTPDGYAVMRIDGRNGYMARWSWELHNGPMDQGLEADHLCVNPPCVNPAHVDPVTHAENVRRSSGFSAVNARKTHCPQGHEYTPENTRRQRRGGRLCRTCQDQYDAGRRKSA